MDVGDLTPELLEDSLDDPFVLISDDERVELILTEVSRISTAPGDAGAPTAFSAVFTGPSEPLLEQSIHNLHNAALGDLEIFLVPIGRDDVGARYEAVFTRLGS